MPKIIENLESRFIEEAEKQIREAGYGSMTIRSVASACNVGVGTVYNYYESKDHLLTAMLMKDWQTCLDSITAVSREAR